MLEGSSSKQTEKQDLFSPGAADRYGLWKRLTKILQRKRGSSSGYESLQTPIDENAEPHFLNQLDEKDPPKIVNERELSSSEKRLKEYLTKEIALSPTDVAHTLCIYCSNNSTIEGNRLDCNVSKKDKKLHVRFRLTPSGIETVRALVTDKPKVKDGTIGFPSERNQVYMRLARSDVILDPDFKIKISNSDNPETVTGYVEIESAASINPNTCTESIVRLQKIFQKLFAISDIYTPLTEQEKKSMMRDQYCWHHKIALGDQGSKQLQEKLDNLTIEPVFDSYETTIDNGSFLELRKKFGRYAVYHHFYGHTIVQVIKAGGIASTYDRLSREIDVETSSPGADILSGGAFSVFTRIVTEQGIAKSEDTEAGFAVLIFKPSLLDRQDWFSYARDRYGSTAKEDLVDRLSPEELFAHLNTHGTYNHKSFAVKNEQMFYKGISVSSFYKLAVYDNEMKENLLKLFHEEGITSVNGTPIEEFIVVGTKTSEIIAHADTSFESEALRKPAILELSEGSFTRQEVSDGGTNQAYIIEFEGTKYYTKEYPANEQARCEYVSNCLYNEMGVPTLKGRLFKIGEKIVYAVPYVDYDRHFALGRDSLGQVQLIDSKTQLPPNEIHRAQLHQIYLTAAWLLDWDAVGVGNKPLGNILVINDERLALIDHGGSLLWRGLQGPKPENTLNDQVTELDVFLDKNGFNPISAAVFDGISTSTIEEEAKKLHEIPNERIAEIVTSAGFPRQTEEKVIRLLLNRKQSIVNRLINEKDK